MPLRPFPYQLNIGTDIASIERIRRLVGKDDHHPRHLVAFLKRVLTRRERLQFWSRYGKYDMRNLKSAAPVHHFLAGRFAAKEATIKAVSSRRQNMSFHDIVIRTPVFGEEMSAIILDKQDTDGRPIQHEVALLAKAETHHQPRTSNKRDRQFGNDKAENAFESAWPTPSTDATPSQQSLPEENAAGAPQAAVMEENVDDGVELSGSIAKISISHDGDYATAVCLAAEESQEGDVGGEAAARGYIISNDTRR